MMQFLPSKMWREGEREGELLQVFLQSVVVTFVGVGGRRSLENVARHDGGGAVHHALVLIVYGGGWRMAKRGCVSRSMIIPMEDG